MTKSTSIFDRLNQSSTTKVVSAENTREADLDDAHNKAKIKQTENASKLGCFIVEWLITVIKILTAFLAVMIFIYICNLVQDLAKLEIVLNNLYSELKLFISEYQSVIAVIATLMFGDKLKDSKDLASK